MLVQPGTMTPVQSPAWGRSALRSRPRRNTSRVFAHIGLVLRNKAKGTARGTGASTSLVLECYSRRKSQDGIATHDGVCGERVAIALVIG
jgi:hypothetical protein